MTKSLSSYEFVDCRTYGHSWSASHFDREPDFGIAVDFLCPRCTTLRRDIYSRYGHLIGRRYVYPEGYKPDHLIPRADFRKEWTKRIRSQIRERNRKN